MTQHSIAFPKLDDQQIAALRRMGTQASFAAGARLFAAGDLGVPFFAIEQGEVALRDDFRGLDEVVAVQGPGEVTGDADILTGKPAPLTAVARSPCATHRIPAAALRRLVDEHPSLADVLLKAFLMRRQLVEESGVAAVRVVGSRYCRDTYRIREFLGRNKIPFAWIDVEQDAAVNGLLSRFRVGVEDTPLVILGNGRLLRSPSIAQLAEALGVRHPVEGTVYDLAIVGAGPAGLAAAVYGASEGLKTVIVDRMAPGGQVGGSSLVENYMGFPEGLSGAELAERGVVQAHKFGASFSIPSEVTRMSCERGFNMLGIDGGEELAARCVVISAGAAYRKLPAADAERFENLGLYYAATAVEAELCRNAQVVIVGGGNSAGQAAVFLAERARMVHLVLRGDDLRKSMSDYLARRIEHTPNVRVRKHTEVERMRGDKWLRLVDLRSRERGQSEEIDCPAAFAFIGAVPHTTWLPSQIALDSRGFVKTGPQPGRAGELPAWPLDRRPFLLETSWPGVFAAGDVREGSVKRVASAVGEGSMAVTFAHQYLAGG